jgi:tetratricopeptide (TPR) repeat protein
MDASMTQASSVTIESSLLDKLARASGRVLACAAVLVFAAAASGCSKLKARDLLNKGVGAFKNGQYDAAIEDFKQARDLDPSLMNARLYLATAYASQYIPGAPSDANMRLGTQAITEFKDVLNVDPNNVTAIDGIGSMLYQMASTPYDPKKFEESKSYHQRHIELKPNDPEPYYWVGVIDWALCFRINNEMRAEYNKNNIKKQVKDTDPLPASVRGPYGAKCGTLVDEGIAALQKSIQLKPDYDDAMAYLNLLYRRKADLVESAEQRDNFLKQADDLVDKVKEIKQRRAEQPQPAS